MLHGIVTALGLIPVMHFPFLLSGTLSAEAGTGGQIVLDARDTFFSSGVFDMCLVCAHCSVPATGNFHIMILMSCSDDSYQHH